MSDAANKAVFLSYASQDAEAARKICEALRAAGVEVWFDQSELRGGDAWDQKIRKQIKECALFVPVISANTNARPEGYFRLEWKLAVDRSHLLADDHPFLFPITVGDVTDATARVPDKFREVQWTRLRLDETPAELASRVVRLLSGEIVGRGRLTPPQERATGSGDPALQTRRARRPTWLSYGWAVVGLVLSLAYGLRPYWPTSRKESALSPLPSAATISEARKLVAQARALLLIPGGTTKFETAALLCERALGLDPTDADVWAVASQVDARMWYHEFDHTPRRSENARSKAVRALNLDPKSFEARLAQATYLVIVAKEPMADQAEPILQSLRAENPHEYRALEILAELFQMQGKDEEALASLDECARLPGVGARARMKAGWVLHRLRRIPEMESELDQSIALQPFAGAVALRVFYDLGWHGDLDRALATLRKLPAEELAEDIGVAAAVRVYTWRREPAELLKFLGNVPRDWITWSLRAPKSALTGDANAALGRLGAARADWQSALALVEQRLAAAPNDRNLLEWKAYLLASLGEKDRARETYARALEAPPDELHLLGPEKIQWLVLPDELIDELERRVQAATTALDKHAQILDYFVSAADLRLNPAWDSVRGLPRFQALQSRLDADPRFNPNAKPVGQIIDDRSVAVLAFANLSDDKGNEYFSDGISEELLNVLAKVPGLKVTARTSSFFFKGKEVPIPEIARQLGVAYVVEGSVRKAGDKVRITAQLIKAADGFHVWSDTFTRELKDVFAVQDEIAGLIARNLSLKMDLGSARRAVNPEAHRLVLEGRYFWNLRTLDGFTRAEAAFTKAIELDPQFAQAHAGLADVRWTRAVFESYAGANLRPTADAVAATEKALALDPTLAEAYPAAGAVLHWSGRLGEAELKFKKAIALNANYALAHHWYSLVLEGQGRLDEALAEIEQAIQSDPFSVAALSTRYRYLLMAGRISEALAAYEKVEALRPGFFFGTGLRAQGLLAAGRRDEALAVAQSVVAYQGLEYRWISDASAVYVLRALGREAEAVAHVEKLLSRLPADSYLRGVALAALDRWDEAMPCLERTPPGLYSIYFWNPIWDRWRAEPSFGRLLAKLGCTKEYQTARETLARMRKEQEAKP